MLLLQVNYISILEKEDIENIDAASIEIWYSPADGASMKELTGFSPVFGNDNLYIVNDNESPLFTATRVRISFTGSEDAATISPGLSIGGCFKDIGNGR